MCAPFKYKTILALPVRNVKIIFIFFERKVILLTSRELVEIIEAELSKKKIPKGEFYKACGISSGHMSNWRRGLNYPQTPTLIKMSDYLGIDLMGKKIPATGDGDGSNGTDDKSALMELYDSFDLSDRARLLAFAQGLRLSRNPHGEAPPKDA